MTYEDLTLDEIVCKTGERDKLPARIVRGAFSLAEGQVKLVPVLLNGLSGPPLGHVEISETEAGLHVKGSIKGSPVIEVLRHSYRLDLCCSILEKSTDESHNIISIEKVDVDAIGISPESARAAAELPLG